MRVTSRPGAHLPSPPLGFALVELLAALVITLLLGAAVVRLLDRSNRFARGVATMADQRAQLAVAAFAVDGALAAVAPGDGDLVAGSDSSIHLQGTVGCAVACAVGAGSIDVADPHLSSGATLTWWNTAPQPGDSVAILDEGASPAGHDDAWYHGAITAIALRAAPCLHSPYLDSIADAATQGWRLTLSPSLPATVLPGSVVRVRRAERFALYRSAGEWMLGWTEWNHGAAAWNTIQPVAGPLLPYAAPGATSGFSVRWVDSAGASVTPTPASTARGAYVALGATTRQQVRVDGVARGARRDSLTLRLVLRNSP
ncbi:MAG: hypothetical protein IT359_21040 [Gemmatimonadaceae bacterium]|nr:hypothetical protein [Gemmatimonadaceae bacterium]